MSQSAACRLVALALGLSLAATAGIAATPAVLSLQDAVRMTVTESPVLKAAGHDMARQEAEVLQAGISPRPQLDVMVENVFGTGENTAFDATQTTVSISWILERGVRERMVEAQRSAIDVVDDEIAIRRLDEAAETARRYVNALVLQTREEVARDGILQMEATVEILQDRLDAGGGLGADVSRARAALARRELMLEDIEHELLSAYHRLAAQWGATEPGFTAVAGELLSLPEAASFETLSLRLEDNPDLRRYLSLQRMQEAQLRLAQARNRQSWRVGAGLRQIELTGDQALVAEFSMPLGRDDANRGRVEALRAEMARTAEEQRAQRVALRADLYVLHQELAHSLHVTAALREDIIPLYRTALEETRAAYEAGRLGYLALAGAQDALLAARYELVDAAADIYRNLIELERLTGVSAEQPRYLP